METRGHWRDFLGPQFQNGSPSKGSLEGWLSSDRLQEVGMRQNGLNIKPLIQCCLEGRKGLSQALTSSIITRTAQEELIRTGMGP